MSQLSMQDAIVLRDVTKSFKKRTIRREYTTLKSELVDFILRRKKRDDSRHQIAALRGIDLVVPRGKTVGILGRNGSGKSTLLKLITGIYTPTSGEMKVNGRISALLDLGAGFHPDFSGRENILINGIILGMSRNDVRARMDEIIAFSELGDFIDEPVRTYSSGMYMRLAFAVATHVDPDILIIDEILAVGDEHFSRKSMGRMTEFKRQGKTIVLVTHDLGTVERWCDLAAWIDGGKIREVGLPSQVVANYRSAVRIAEEANTVFTPSALAADGGALPSLAAEHAKTDAAPAVTAVRISGRQTNASAALDAQGACDVAIDYDTRGLSNCVISAEIRTRQDQMLFKSELPAPAAKGSVTLSLDRTALAPGSYRIVAAVASGPSKGTGEADLEVAGAVNPSGPLLSLPHRWSFDEQSGTVTVPERRAAVAS